MADQPREAFGLPDIGKIESMLDQRFQALIAKLDEVLEELRNIKGEVRALQP